MEIKSAAAKDIEGSEGHGRESAEDLTEYLKSHGLLVETWILKHC